MQLAARASTEVPSNSCNLSCSASVVATTYTSLSCRVDRALRALDHLTAKLLDGINSQATHNTRINGGNRSEGTVGNRAHCRSTSGLYVRTLVALAVADTASPHRECAGFHQSDPTVGRKIVGDKALALFRRRRCRDIARDNCARLRCDTTSNVRIDSNRSSEQFQTQWMHLIGCKNI